MGNSLINSELIALARECNNKAAKYEKSSFVDPATMGGAPPGGDPAAMGGAPPPGGDPAAAGGAPPGGDPAAMGGDPLAGLQPMIQQAVQQAMMASGGGGGGGEGAGIKPKIDVNVALMQLSKMVARLADAMGVSIPASEMIATPDDLNSMATDQSTNQGIGSPAPPPGGGGAPPTSAIAPIEPVQPASPDLAAAGGGGGAPGGQKMGEYAGGNVGKAYDGSRVLQMGNRASALAHVLRRERAR